MHLHAGTWMLTPLAYRIFPHSLAAHLLWQAAPLASCSATTPPCLPVLQAAQAEAEQYRSAAQEARAAAQQVEAEAGQLREREGAWALDKAGLEAALAEGRRSLEEAQAELRELQAGGGGRDEREVLAAAGSRPAAHSRVAA